MIVKSNKDRSVVAEGLDKKSFFMGDVSKIFEILQDKIYSDKPLAVIREYSTNAMDAHVDIDKRNVPICIALPHDDSPFFSVRDYGTGLSEERIYKHYIGYGESGSSHTNDKIGGWGLGSKAGFAYSDNFFVTSFYNGKRTLYQLLLVNEEGYTRKMPSIIKIDESDSDEPSGMFIEIAVQEEDYSKFYDKTIELFLYFDVKPVAADSFTNKLFKRWDNIWKIYSNNDIGVDVYALKDMPCLSKEAGSQKKVFITLGGIPYKVSLDEPVNESETCVYCGVSTRYSVNEIRVIYRFNIGELEIATSRESIIENDKTKNKIKAKIARYAKIAPNVANYIYDNLSQETIFQELIKPYYFKFLSFFMTDVKFLNYTYNLKSSIIVNNSLSVHKTFYVHYEDKQSIKVVNGIHIVDKNGAFLYYDHVKLSNFESLITFKEKIKTPRFNNKTIITDQTYVDYPEICDILKSALPVKKENLPIKNKTLLNVYSFRNDSYQIGYSTVSISSFQEKGFTHYLLFNTKHQEFTINGRTIYRDLQDIASLLKEKNIFLTDYTKIAIVKSSTAKSKLKNLINFENEIIEKINHYYENEKDFKDIVFLKTLQKVSLNKNAILYRVLFNREECQLLTKLDFVRQILSSFESFYESIDKFHLLLDVVISKKYSYYDMTSYYLHLKDVISSKVDICEDIIEANLDNMPLWKIVCSCSYMVNFSLLKNNIDKELLKYLKMLDKVS